MAHYDERFMERRDDANIAERLLARDEDALRTVIERYGSLVHGVARRIIAETTMAEEVAQDTFLALWRRPGAFDPQRGSLQTFLASVARNKAVDLVRREDSIRRRAEALLAESQTMPDTETPAAGIDERHEVVSALKQLTEPQRQALVLAYFGGRTYREVADELEIPEGTAKTRMRDGLKKLRELMAAEK